MSYTKGPWAVEKSGSSSTGSVHYAVKTAYKPKEHPHSPRFIVFMCGGLGDYHPSRSMNDYRGDPQIEADVNLIAAAPDLLEAANSIYSGALNVSGDGQRATVNVSIEAFKSLERAIAKAEGKQ